MRLICTSKYGGWKMFFWPKMCAHVNIFFCPMVSVQFFLNMIWSICQCYGLNKGRKCPKLLDAITYRSHCFSLPGRLQRFFHFVYLKVCYSFKKLFQTFILFRTKNFKRDFFSYLLIINVYPFFTIQFQNFTKNQILQLAYPSVLVPR